MPQNHIMIPFNDKCHNVNVHDILYIECKGRHCVVHTTIRKYSTYLRLTAIEEILKINNFVRTHQSYVIPLERVDFFTEAEVTLKGDKPGEKISLPMGRTYCFTERYRTLKVESKKRRK